MEGREENQEGERGRAEEERAGEEKRKGYFKDRCIAFQVRSNTFH